MHSAPAPEPQSTPEDLLLASGLREALRSDDPTAITALVSSLLFVTTQWTDAIDDGDDQVVIPIEALIESFIGTPFAETTAALHVIAALLRDELDAARVRRALASRRHPMPAHVTGVRDIAVTRAGHVGDELGDGDNVMLGLEWPGTQGVTMVAYVDQSFGTRVKDVFLVPEPIDDVLDRYRELIAEQGQDVGCLAEIDVADARASLQRAIERGEAPDAPPLPDGWPGPDSDPLGWPTARPFLEMLLRGMPSGGSSVLVVDGFPEMSGADAVESFLAAPQSDGLRDPHARTAADLLARDAAQGAGHPLRWSSLQVEYALTQRLPWDPDATDEALERVGDVLPAYIRFAHARLDIPAAMTTQTLSAVHRWMPVFDSLSEGMSGR